MIAGAVFVAVIISVITIGNVVNSISNHTVIVVISFDGFRYNYFDKHVSPNLQKLRNSETYADYMRNAFITKTFTNHHSIATGLYPETHGVLGNSLYDPKYNKVIKYGYELWHYNEEIVPIWVS